MRERREREERNWKMLDMCSLDVLEIEKTKEGHNFKWSSAEMEVQPWECAFIARMCGL